jgi:5-formyltetrahydrofolate cyclo-ligase
LESILACDENGTGKQDHRQKAQARRHRLKSASPNAAKEAARNFLNVFKPAAKDIVGAYWPYKSEINTRPLLIQLHNQAIVCALPVVLQDDQRLTFHAWKPGDTLSPGAYGISEPSRESLALAPSILVVPLLAFDDRGYRLGYGAGYYDKTLRQLRSAGRVTAVGFAFSGQRVDEIPRQPHDERLDWIVTDERVLKAQS